MQQLLVTAFIALPIVLLVYVHVRIFSSATHIFSLLPAYWPRVTTGSEAYMQFDFEAIYNVTAVEVVGLYHFYTKHLRYQL